MYKCDICGNQTLPGVSCNNLVVETRDKVYLPRPKVNDPGGSGYETVKEMRVCPECMGEQ